jgi:hypothetical protein
MPLLNALDVRLTRDRFDDPLVIIDTPLGNGMAASPAQLRELARTFLLVATAAEAYPTKTKHFTDAPRTFPMNMYPDARK